MHGENPTIRPSDMSSRPTVQHTSYALHMLSIGMVLPNAWSIQSLKRPGEWWLTPRLKFSSREKQSIPQSISIRDHRMNAWKEMTTMAIKHHTKYHTRCCMHFENRHTMQTATKYHIKLLSTTNADSDVMPADTSLKSNDMANSARDQSPA